MIDDATLPPAVKLAAIKEALNRTLGKSRQTVEVSYESKPWEQLFEGIARGMPATGSSDRPDWADPNDDRFGDIVDAEVVDPYEDNAPDPESGRVHCTECDAPFPDLDALHAAGLSKYGRRCAACREAARAERAEDRELDSKIGAPTGTRPPLDPLRERSRPYGTQSADRAPQVDRTPGRNPRYPVQPRRRA